MKNSFPTAWPFHSKVLLAACAACILALTFAGGQEPPAAGKAEEDPFGKKAEDAAAAGTEKAKADGAKAKATLKTEPLVLRHLRESNPTTPEELLRAAEVTLNFGRPDEAKKYLAKFLAAKPDEAVLAGLASQFGTDLFLRLSRDKDVQPEGKQTADLVLIAADKAVKDPARIARLIGEVCSADPKRRELAQNDLSRAGVDAVPPLIAILGDASRSKDMAYVQGALLRLKVVSERPLLGALESPDEAQRNQIIQTVGLLGSREAVPFLVRPAVDPAGSPETRKAAADALQRILNASPTLAEGERFLQRRVKQILAAADVLAVDLSDEVEIWRWDAAQKGPAPLRLPRSDASLLVAARLAADLHALAPTKNEYLRLKVMTRMELDKVLGGLDQPLPKTSEGFILAKEAGPEVVHQVLADAIKQNRVAAAIAAAEMLGEVGQASILAARGSAQSELALALHHPDRRLRFSASQAIMRLNSRESFPGAGHFTDALAHFAATSGTRRALIGHPRADEGQTLVGYMNELGYEAEAAYTGKGVMQFAIASPDYDFLLISDALDAPQISELVQWLRRDYRTARLPIGIMVGSERLEAMKDAFRGDLLTTVFPRIHDTDTAAYEVSRLSAVAGRTLITPDERVEQASAALGGLAFLAASPERLAAYDLLRHEEAVIRALTAPGLSARAAKVLGLLGTPKCQTALVDFISQHARPLADRKAAAAAFAEAVSLRGILLTKSQILLQYDRYNGSATLDKETQTILSAVLDTLESRSQPQSKKE